MSNTRIRATDVAAIFGDNPYKTEYELWQELTGMIPHHDSTTARTKWGQLLEAAVLAEYADRHGAKLVTPPTVAKGIITGRADAMHGSHIVEAKVTVSYAHRTWGGELPARYWWQVQMYMYLYDCSAATVCVYCRDNDNYYEYPATRYADIEKELQKIESWYQTYVVANVPPPHDAPVISDSGSQVHATSDLADLVAEWRRIDSEERDNKTRLEEIKKQVQEVMQEKEELWCDGAPAVTWRSSTRTALDTTALKNGAPEIFKQYQTTTATRTMRLLLQKKGEY